MTPTPPHPGPGSIRILCVDDHAFLVEGLKAQFSVTGGGSEFSVVGRLTTAQKLLQESERLRPDIILLDIEMPGPDPFEMADRLHRVSDRGKVVFLSAYVRDHYIGEAYRCGACGYFSKADEIVDIVEGLRQVAKGEGDFVFGPKVKSRCRPAKETRTLGGGVIREKQTQPPSRLDTLTPRELEVLRLIGRGMGRIEIGNALSRASKTIDEHQSNMLQKLGLINRAELMRFAIREGVVEA